MSHSELQLARVIEHGSELRRRAAARRRLKAPSQSTPKEDARTFSIRPATADDQQVLQRLAALDSSHAPDGEILIGAIDDEPAAAIGVADGHIVADPFRPTAELVSLLRARRGQLASIVPRRSRKRLASGATAPSTLRGTGGPYGH